MHALGFAPSLAHGIGVLTFFCQLDVALALIIQRKKHFFSGFLLLFVLIDSPKLYTSCFFLIVTFPSRVFVVVVDISRMKNCGWNGNCLTEGFNCPMTSSQQVFLH